MFVSNGKYIDNISLLFFFHTKIFVVEFSVLTYTVMFSVDEFAIVVELGLHTGQKNRLRRSYIWPLNVEEFTSYICLVYSKELESVISSGKGFRVIVSFSINNIKVRRVNRRHGVVCSEISRKLKLRCHFQRHCM